AALVGAAAVVVLHPEPDEGADGAVVHADVALDLQLAARGGEILRLLRGELQHLGGLREVAIDVLERVVSHGASSSGRSAPSPEPSTLLPDGAAANRDARRRASMMRADV